MSSPAPRPQAPPKAHLQAVLALCIGFFFVCAGTPGTRSIGPKALNPKRIQQARQKAGPFADLYEATLKLNFAIRVPISKHFVPMQSVFRIAQNWGLYGTGPNRIRRIQIDVDGETVYLTNDPDLRWRVHQLSHRKIRPMPDTMSLKADAYNWTGFQRWVLEEILEDFPEAREVSILAIWTARDPGAKSFIHHGRHAEAPDWTWHMIGEGGTVEGPVSGGAPE